MVTIQLKIYLSAYLALNFEKFSSYKESIDSIIVEVQTSGIKKKKKEVKIYDDEELSKKQGKLLREIQEIRKVFESSDRS